MIRLIVNKNTDTVWDILEGCHEYKIYNTSFKECRELCVREHVYDIPSVDDGFGWKSFTDPLDDNLYDIPVILTNPESIFYLDLYNDIRYRVIFSTGKYGRDLLSSLKIPSRYLPALKLNKGSEWKAGLSIDKIKNLINGELI